MLKIVFQVGQLGSSYASALTKNKNLIIVFNILCALFNALSIITAGSILASIPVFFTIIRSLVCLFKERFKSDKPIWLCTLGYVIIGCFTIYNSSDILDILPTISSALAGLILWFFKPRNIKIGLGLTNSMWLVYYIVCGLYISALSIVSQILMLVIGILRIELSNRRSIKNTNENIC